MDKKTDYNRLSYLRIRVLSIGVTILIATLFLSACELRHTIPVHPVQVDPEVELFSRAEKLFKAESYEKALEAYNEYLSRFPGRPLGAAALMKTGTINAILKNNAEARSIYKRLIAEYPGSPFVSDAMVEIPVTFYNEGRYREAIKEAGNIPDDTLSRVQLIRTYTLLGDAYMAIGSPVNAVYFYIMAHEESKKREREDIIIKLKEAARQLNSAGVASLLRRTEDKISKGYPLYLLGHSKAKEGKYGAAIMALSEFVKRFPRDEKARQAEHLIGELSKKSAYNRHTIGCLLPLSGPYKIYGKMALSGVELALSQFSSQEGSPPVKIIVKDTGSDADKSVLAVQELSRSRVAAIIGPVFTAEPAATEAQVSEIPIITLTQMDNITDIGGKVFRNFTTPRMQVKTIVSYAIEELGLNSFAILYPDEKYGRTFMSLFRDEVIARGGRIAGIESYSLSQTDFADPIKKLIKFCNEKTEPAVAFDAIFIPDAPDKAGLIIPQLVFHGVEDVYFFGTNLWHSDRLIRMARRSVQGAIMPDGFFAESSSENVRNFVKNFKETFGKRPGFIEAVAYDTTMMLLQTISRPDIQSRSRIREELINLDDFHGVTGFTSFDSSGDVQKSLYLLQIRGERFVELIN